MKTSDISSGRSNNNYFAKRRLRLLEKDPHCNWCGKEVKDYPDYNTWRYKYPVGDPRRRMPDDYATIDHLNSRFLNGRRKDTRMKEKTLVLSCPACNNERNKQEEQKYSFRKRWKSASFPYPFRWLGTLLRRYRKLNKKCRTHFHSLLSAKKHITK